VVLSRADAFMVFPSNASADHLSVITVLTHMDGIRCEDVVGNNGIHQNFNNQTW
jgi:hypothetical protein